MVNSNIHGREDAYRSASRSFDYFVTAVSCLFFLATVLCIEVDGGAVTKTVTFAAIVLFASSIFAGLKKLEYYVAILGTDYTVCMTEADQTNLTVRESTAVLRDLNATLERLSARASVVHRVRNWLLLLGILAVVALRFLQVVQAF